MLESWLNQGGNMALAALQKQQLDLVKQEVKYDAGFAPAYVSDRQTPATIKMRRYRGEYGES